MFHSLLLRHFKSNKIGLVTETHLGSSLGVQNEQFSEEKDSLYVLLKRKYSFCQDSNHRSMDYEANSLPLNYLTCWWMGINVAKIKYQIVCLQINQAYAIVTKWQILNNFEQNAVKKPAILTLATSDVFLVKMWQECYNRRESWVF